MLGKQAYNVSEPFLNFAGTDLPKGNAFLGAKVPAEDIEGLIHLQALGFFVVDVNIQLAGTAGVSVPKNDRIRFAGPEDEQAVRSLAGSSLRHNRFHRDPKIPEKVASRIKEEWAGNFFSGKRGDWMVVAEVDGQVNGFLQLIKQDKETMIIDLVAVAQNSREKGMARAMISYASKACLDSLSVIKAGTQLANTASLALYNSLGFRVVSASYAMHKHIKG